MPPDPLEYEPNRAKPLTGFDRFGLVLTVLGIVFGILLICAMIIFMR